MTDKEQRQYLEGVPTDIQDLIYEERASEAVNLLMAQKGLNKMQAAIETARIAHRMKEAFPDAISAPSSKSEPRLTPRQQSVIIWTIVTLFALAGAAASIFGVRGVLRAKVSMDWPTTQGKILESSVERKTHRKTGSGTISKTSNSYHANISYEYNVDGTAFRGKRVAYGDHGRGKSSYARDIVKRYPKGKSVTVHYMPGNPKESLLEPGLQLQAFGWPVIGAILLLVAGALAFVRHRGTRS